MDKIKDSVYFSFVTATTTGFGDIIPFGLFKFIALFEVVFGLMLLAVVTSKLVSIKQDVILSGLYEFSLNEKANRLRASLLLFRQNLDRIIVKIEAKDIQKREISGIYIYFSSLEDSLSETFNLIERSDKNKHFIKNIDPVSAELIFNSILTSFEKLNELLSIMNQNKIEWKTELTTDLINRCLGITESLFNELDPSAIRKGIINDLNSRKNKVIAMIKSSIDNK